MVNKTTYIGLGTVFVLLLILAVFLSIRGSGKVKTDIALYYVNPNEYILEKRIIQVDGKADLKTALTSLFKGIEDSKIENLFPKGVKFIGSKEDKENEVLEINLSSNVLSANYGIKVNYLYIMSIVLTVSDFSGYEKVKLTFDGKVVEFFNNGLYMGDALKRDDSVVKL